MAKALTNQADNSSVLATQHDKLDRILNDYVIHGVRAFKCRDNAYMVANLKRRVSEWSVSSLVALIGEDKFDYSDDYNQAYSDGWNDAKGELRMRVSEHNADSPETSTDTASLPLLDTIRRQLLAEIGEDEEPAGHYLSHDGLLELSQRNIVRAGVREAINRILNTKEEK